MQAVFAVAAVTLFVPVIYHRQRNEEVSGLDVNAPGEQTCFQRTTGGLSSSVPVFLPCQNRPVVSLSGHSTPQRSRHSCNRLSPSADCCGICAIAPTTAHCYLSPSRAICLELSGA